MSANNLTPMCEEDHNECGHAIVDGIKYCDVCGEAVCPICGCHSVDQISRITGYMGSLKGWNSAKQQELKDRTRVTAAELISTNPVI